MKLLVVLALWAQLLSCRAIPLSPPLQSKIVNCDDPEAEEAAFVARDYINSHTLHGYKINLNKIKNIKILPRRPTGEIIAMELEFLETTCHVISPVPVENCTLRQHHEHAVEGDCDVKLLRQDGKLSVLATKCHSSPDSVEDLTRLCPECTPMASLDNPSVISTVNAALAKYNTEDATCYYKLLEISRGKITHMPVGTYVEFAIAGTNCTAQEAKENVENCKVESGDHAHFGFCSASIVKVPEISPEGEKHVESTTVSCEIYDSKPGLSHTHLTVHHLGGNRPSPAANAKVLDLIHSHNNTHASHESHSAEVPVAPAVPAAPAVVKRAVVAVEPEAPQAVLLPVVPMPVCPGRTRHFNI